LQKILCDKSTNSVIKYADKLYHCAMDDEAVVMTFNKKKRQPCHIKNLSRDFSQLTHYRRQHL